ncbi:MAG: hypothetical protein ACUZ8O_14465 [Candidatus Anammoxibacter sp.]
MRIKKTKSSINVIKIIEHIESQLSGLKKAIKETKPIIKGEKKRFLSVREYDFCGMWKDRADMKGLSSAEWLAKLRREQWVRR